MSKFFQAFLSGIFFTFICDFFIILGVKINYIDFYNIDVYYNILFADNQNIFIFAIFSALFGYLLTYLKNMKIAIVIIGSSFVLSTLTLIEPIGHSVAEMMLMSKNTTLKDSKHSYSGDIYYDGRENITFYDKEIQKIIILKKKDLIK